MSANESLDAPIGVANFEHVAFDPQQEEHHEHIDEEAPCASMSAPGPAPATPSRMAHVFRPPMRVDSAHHMPSTLVSWASTGKVSSPRPLLRLDQTYSPRCPPVAVLRCNDHQLMYQIGKIAPLTPLFASFQVKSPPQRDSLSDLRLSASQRSQSSYARPPSASPPLTSKLSCRQDITCPAQSTVRPQTAPSSAAARLYGKKELNSNADGLAIASKSQRPATANSNGNRPAPSHLVKASQALSQALAQGLSSHTYTGHIVQRLNLVQSQEKGPGLTYRARVTRLKQLLD